MLTFAMLGGQELWIVLVIVILLFGAGKIPQLMKSMGQGVREFRKVSKDIEGSLDEMKEPMKEVRSAVTEAKDSVAKAIEQDLSPTARTPDARSGATDDGNGSPS